MSKSLGVPLLKWCWKTIWCGNLASLGNKCGLQATTCVSLWTILSQVSETYRKIRNTLRFLIANTSDFNPAQDAVAYDELRSVDKYMTVRFNQLVKTIRDAYADFEFLTIYRPWWTLSTLTCQPSTSTSLKKTLSISKVPNHSNVVKCRRLLWRTCAKSPQNSWHQSFLTQQRKSGHILSLKLKLVQLSWCRSWKLCQPGKKSHGYMGSLHGLPRTSSKSLGRSACLSYRKWRSTLDDLSNEVVKALLGAVDSNVAQLWSCQSWPSPRRTSSEAAVSFWGCCLYSWTRGQVCDRCRVSTQQQQNAATMPVICDRCAAS